MKSFEEMFVAATGKAPFPYQKRIAEGDELPSLLAVPTGAGKTAAAVLGWVWRRRFASEIIRKTTPRRLVYCLPMRVLVEQTEGECRKWLTNLGLDNPDSGGIDVKLLMGGDYDNDWDLYPERDAILIGTQDMLLSRALNRGYATSRYRWPTQFGLLHSDALWIFDETQLFGVGLKTSAQLEAFRRSIKTVFPAHSLWMSATLKEEELQTVDVRETLPSPLPRMQLDDNDRDALKKRLEADKKLIRIDLDFSPPTQRNFVRGMEFCISSYYGGLNGTMLIVLNTVSRAQELYQELKKKGVYGNVLLIHSRFRQTERNEQNQKLKECRTDERRIIVATQAIEAGVDISSQMLITELAPWSSLAQRFGRCNRYGEYDNARVLWIDFPNPPAPYTSEQLHKAKEILNSLKDVGPTSIEGITDGLPDPISHVIRRKDLIELFDTTPDLAGADIDISRFIRDENNLDVQVYWRTYEDKPVSEMSKPKREELCSIRIGAFRDFFKKTKGKGLFWVWDAFDGTWARLDETRIRPGLVVLAHTNAGGYNVQLGWTADPKDSVEEISFGETDAEEANSDDPQTDVGRFISLAEHSNDVVAELEVLLDALGLNGEEAEALRAAARHHDWGKAHEEFQQMLLARDEVDPPVPDGGPWAKSDRFKRRNQKDNPRPQFRHELASALAALQDGQSDLACYLIAAHHGKVRLSIRSMPEEKLPPEPGRRFARGIWDGETLPACDLGSGDGQKDAIALNLEPMELGRNRDGKPSWLERTLTLRDTYGPFRLALLESLLRAADRSASQKESNS